MKTAAIANLYESIRPVHTAEAGFVKIQRIPSRGAQCAPTVWPPVLPQVALRITAILMLLASLLVLGSRAAVAQESMQYSFGATNVEAKNPESNLIFDSKGNLYGTSLSGGANGYGTVFELSPGTGGVWTETVLYSFGGELAHDGSGPSGGLVFDMQGNLYGLTGSGGVYGYGAAFELSPHAGGAWTEQVLHSFDYSTAEGSTPAGSLVIDGSGNLYGAGSAGGTHFDGTIFELSPGAGGWTQTILYNFGASGDAAGPAAGPIFDKSGNLFGTTYNGGISNGGAVYELSPAAGGTWTEKVLHSFPINAATDGWAPNNTLILDSAGNLYGTTHAGGHQNGTVFELTPASGGVWTEKLLYSFNPTDANPDCQLPVGNIVFDSHGNLYGTAFGASGGGFSGYGALYKLTPVGDGTWTFLILHEFTGDYTPENVAQDGVNPEGGLTIDAANNLYGTTENGGLNAYGAFFVQGPESAVAAPVFSPVEGTYGTSPSITITTATPGATIYYSTTQIPDTTSTVYTGPFTIPSSKNIEAFATAPGLLPSTYPLARYTITPTTVTPTFSPAAGTYTSAQSVTLTDGTSGATIYYTTNGTTPTISSTKYTAAIAVSATETIEAIAVASGFANSNVASATYTLVAPTAATPAFSPAVGTYTTAQSVTISDGTSGATIYYTTNGSTPTISSIRYTGAITVSATETIEAIAVATGYTNSTVATATYTITAVAATPALSLATGTYTSVQNVTITDATPGAIIYYTTNGTMPGASSAVYAGAITVSESETIQAIAVASGYANSPVASATYTIQLPTGAGGESILYNFGILGSPATPNSTPVLDGKGNVYGTTLDEITSLGLLQRGSVYEMSHDSGGGWTESTLFTFNTSATGDTPNGVIFDSAKANLYGTTQDGGTSSAGTVFKLSPNGAGAWTETILWSFGITAADGSTPEGSLVFDGAGNLYGTTNGGGAHSYGTIFELSPNGAGGWTEKVLYSFAGSSIGDGSNPRAGLTFDTKGNLYGTTYSSGASGGYGTVFELSPATGGTWTEQVLHTFAIAGTFDVGTPIGSLTLDSAGNVYGTGNAGGAHNSGAVYELSPGTSGWTEQLIYSFNGTAGSSDGVSPEGGVIFDAQGNLWGTAFHGGTHPPEGTIYELIPAGGSWTEQVRYNFNDSSSNDGFYPEASLALDSSGNFYGITTQGGAYTYGTLYEFTPTAVAATPTFSPAPGTYSVPTSVTISDATAGATIYYTVNGTTPTTASTKYTGAFLVSATETVEAIAVATGYSTSATASGTYTIETPAATPTFSPVAGTYTSVQSVTISDSTSGASTYYTTNGTTPTTASTMYTGAISVSSTETIEAIAVATGYTNSTVASAVYTITLQAATPVFSVNAGTYSSAQTVTITDATAGATIYYTSNGTAPTASSTKYTGAISVSATETLKAIAIATGYSNSVVASALYTITLPTAATPVFSPAAGSYTSTQSVTISDSTTGATIYYTTNGTTPSASSTKYTGAISVSSTETIEAIAIATGYTDSAVASATYTITTPTVALPVFSPAAGTYTATQSVTIADSTAGAAIYYTTNGTTPTTASTKYTSAISVASTETIEAIAVATGYNNSAIASATYTIAPPAATPTFSPAAGTYASVQNVTIADATAGATIYYTTNGTMPSTSSTKYTGAISVSTTETVEAIAAGTGYSSSAVASATYTINIPAAATPVFSPVAGTYTSVQSVTITDTTAGAAIYYTTDGTAPSAASARYTSPISVGATETIKAIAIAASFSNSAVVSATYTINIPVAATPVFTPAAGAYTAAQSVTIADSTTGATIYYTTDGSTPSASSTKYTVAISVGATETIKAIAIATGYTNSAVASATYTINIPVAATPVFSPVAGAYTSAQTVTITDATTGATIYYTTDGSMPSASSTAYTAAISVGATETIKAIAVATGYNNSIVVSATYTINIPVPSFTLSASPSSITVAPGQSATAMISVTSVAGFTGATSFACSGLPAETTCTFAPPTVTPTAGAPATTTLTISATASAAMLRQQAPPVFPGRLPGGATLAVALCFFGLRKRRRLQTVVVFAAALVGTGLLVGCGGSSKPKSMTSTVTVTATSGAIQQTIPISITIE